MLNPQASTQATPQANISPAQAQNGGQATPPAAVPQTMPEAPLEGQETASSPEGQGESPIIQALQDHLNQIPDEQKQFLAEHLTPEFVQAIGIINGPEVAEYLNQFADPDKVMISVPRSVAEQYRQQNQQGQPAGQAQEAAPAPQSPMPQAAPVQAAPQGMMAPK